MNLNNISDEELDRLFKASAENFDPPFDPEAWAAMDQRLEMVQVRHSWFRRFYPYICMVGLVSLMVVSTKMNSKQPEGTSKQSTASTGKQVEQSSELKELKDNQHRASARLSELIETKTLDNKLSYLNRSSEQAFQSEPQEASIHRDNYSLNENKAKTKANKVQQKFSRPLLAAYEAPSSVKEIETYRKADNWADESLPYAYRNREAVAINVVTKDESVSEPNKERKEVVYPIDSSKTAVSAVRSALIISPVDSVQNVSIDTTNQEEPAALERKSWFLNSVQIAVAVAPDVTTVKFKDPDGVSANAGVLLGVPLTRRLSLVTGVVWANKVYSANPREYDFTSGYAYTSSIEATCKVLDIPVNLRYQVFEAEKNAFAVQAGLSSYLMLNEKYSSKNGYYSYNYEVENKNQHWFKVQNVSLVYTRTISPIFSVGVEPFVKIPYSGIGTGKLKLTSAGMFFTAGYTLKLKP